MKYSYIILLLFIVSCSTKVIKEDSSIKTKKYLEVENFKGYGYIVYNESFQDFFTQIYFFPSDFNEEKLSKDDFFKSRKKYPAIIFKINENQFFEEYGFNKKDQNYLTKNDCFCNTIDTYNGYDINEIKYKWKKVFLVYKNYKENFDYERFDKKMEKISQIDSCYFRCITPTDSSTLKIILL